MYFGVIEHSPFFYRKGRLACPGPARLREADKAAWAAEEPRGRTSTSQRNVDTHPSTSPAGHRWSLDVCCCPPRSLRPGSDTAGATAGRNQRAESTRSPFAASRLPSAQGRCRGTHIHRSSVFVQRLGRWGGLAKLRERFPRGGKSSASLVGRFCFLC